jgi:uncharacterized membrane protein
MATAQDAETGHGPAATLTALEVPAGPEPATTPPAPGTRAGREEPAGSPIPRAGRLVPYLIAAVFCVGYSVYSIQFHRHLRTGGFDVGLFEQAVRGYAHLHAPIADLRAPGFNLLGDHFHPILILLAPVYRIFPSPVTILVAQAVLLAVSIVPVARLAARYAGVLAGACVGVAYGLSWGIQQAVGFDFHEVAFAVPLLAFALERLVLRRWVAAVAWAVPLVLVKEDLGMTLAAMGAVLFLRRQRRLGAGLAVFGVVSTAVEMFVIVPAFNLTHQYGFWGHMSEGESGAKVGLVAGLLGVVTHLLTPWAKTRTLLLILAPTAFLALRSSLVIMIVPTLLWRFATNNPSYWVDNYHYNLVLMPIVFMAFVETLPRLLGSDRWPLRIGSRITVRPLRVAGQIAAPVTLAIALFLAQDRPLVGLVDGSALRRDPGAEAIRAQLDRIPDGASVGAGNRLAPQLTNRCTVYLLPDFRVAGLRPQWVVVASGGDWPLDAEHQEMEITTLKSLGYQEVVRQPGLVMLRR